jgi:hypothetical protein
MNAVPFPNLKIDHEHRLARTAVFGAAAHP